MPDDRSKLEPIDPSTARELFLDHKEGECAEATVRNYRYHLKPFVEWCDQEEVHNLNYLTGRDLQQFRLWRKETAEMTRLTLKNHMSSLRVFLKWCASIEGVAPELYDKILIPRVPPEERQRDETLDVDDADVILNYLERYHYASSEHVVLALLWETGMRTGGALALDLGDVDLEQEVLRLVHRPGTDTPLKNAERGERPVAISPELSTLLGDYISDRRNNVTDEHERKPLLTTEHGRMRTSTLRRIVYKITSPCFRGDPCQGCTDSPAEKCDGAVSPHAIRRGSITHHLSNDVPTEVVSDRMNVGRDVLDEHYDKRSEEVKLEQRRGYLDSI